MKNLIPSKSKYLILVLVLIFNYTNAFSQTNNSTSIITGANQTEKYIPLLKGKNIAVVTNQTGIVFKKNGSQIHLIDSLLSLSVSIQKVFAPEHGFRGKADASEHVSNNIDTKTGLPIISLYGKNKKLPPSLLENIDVVLFDIQDVGVRFYTYISTMTYVMETCAALKIPFIILDRPNPNGHYVDGPTLKMEYKSFVGMHPVPLVYGMTIGEYAQMVNGENWLKNNLQCDLTVIPLQNYTHNSEYNLPIRPSPNLPNSTSINLYPSLGFFEGTTINAGRGTEFQFQRYGAPFFPKGEFVYTPQANFGAKYPKFKNKLCYGVDLKKTERLNKIDLSFLIDAYQKTPKNKDFFGATFTIHAGNTTLQKQIETGMTAKEIRNTWQSNIDAFKNIRKKYLIYD